MIPGYRIEKQLYQGIKSAVYQAIRLEDREPVILKFLCREYPDSREIAVFHAEYRRLCSLSLEGVIRAYDIKKYGHSYAMVLEDCGGESIATWQEKRKKKFSLDEWLPLGIRIVEILADLHACGIVHRNITPHNVLWNPKNGLVKLIDFAHSIRFKVDSREPREECIDPAYISPEETGRMNRVIDYRSDFYSLGVMFYQMATGRLPFESGDPMELFHCHISRLPLSPCTLDPTIPEAISSIVLKMMSKMPEQRYQSAYGIFSDLHKCMRRREENGKIDAFVLGENDVSPQFRIPQRLYGRERESEKLRECFERTTKGAHPIVMISGYSGTGKTALVHDLERTVIERRGYFLSGKFDPILGEQSHNAFAEAFQKWIKHLFFESDEQIASWKEKVKKAIGRNGRILTDFIPQMECLLEKQPDLPFLSPAEFQSMFRQVFQNFVRVLGSSEHPVVLFLDDLQWCDSNALQWFKYICEDLEIHHLLLVGSYRENEVHEGNPLFSILNEIESGGTHLERMSLAPISLPALSQWIAETLAQETPEVLPMADLCLKKTGGNPFFMRQFLHSLYNRGAIWWDESRRKWQWNIQEIEETAVQDMADWLSRRMTKLPQETIGLLKIASCLGSWFELSILSALSRTSGKDAMERLQLVLQEGFIFPAGHETQIAFKFLHDQVRQVAYSLLDESERQWIHLEAGRAFLKDSSPKTRDREYRIVNHFNQAIESITKEEREVLARLNLSVGIQARQSNAVSTALACLRRAKDFFPETIWEKEEPSAHLLFKNLAEVEWLVGNLDVSFLLLEEAIRKTSTRIGKAELYHLLSMQYTAIAQYEKAIESAREGLRMLEADFTEQGEGGQEIERTLASLEKFSIASLIDHPFMKSPSYKMAMRLLQGLDGPIYYSHQEFFERVIAKKVEISLAHGHTPESCGGYYCLGMLLGSRFGEPRMAYELGKLALRLAEKFQDAVQRCKASNMLANFILPWVAHIRESDELNESGYLEGMEAGEFTFAGYILGHKVLNDFFYGKPIGHILQKIDEFSLFVQKHKNQLQQDAFEGIKRVLSNLGDSSGVDRPDLDGPEEKTYRKNCHEHQSFLARFIYLVLNAQFLYLNGRHEESSRCLLEAKNLPAVPFSMVICSEHNFYESLTILKLYEKDAQKGLWERIEENQRSMHRWAEYCPQNFEHKYTLVEAEKARVSGDSLRAMDLYEQSIASANEHGFIHGAALSNELAAEFYRSRGKKKIAILYLKEAMYGYSRWGAQTKVSLLEKSFASFVEYGPGLARREEPIPSKTRVDEITALLKAFHPMPTENDLSKLWENLLRITAEVSGAQKVALIVEKKRKLFVEACYLCDTTPSFALRSMPLQMADDLAVSLINYAHRIRQEVVIDDASDEARIGNDPYICRERPKSMVCIPIIHPQKAISLLYLENRLTTHAFSFRVLELVRLLASQIALSYENTLLAQSLNEEIERQEQAEQELRESEEKYRILFDQAGDHLVLFDLKTGGIAEANHAVCEAFGYSTSQLQKMNIRDIDVFFTDEGLRQRMENISREGKDVFETKCRLKSGEIRDYLINVRRVKIRGKDFGLCINRDITERKETEKRAFDYQKELEERVKARTLELIQTNERLRKEIEERKVVEQELLKAQCIESLGVLAGGIAHDFNNFLNALMGNISLVKEDSQGENAEILADAEEACMRAKELTGQLLTFSRGGLPVKKVASVVELIRSCASFSLRGYNVSCSFDFQENLWKAEIDESQIGQVIHNLVINAKQAMPGGGKIKICVANAEVGPEDQIPLGKGRYLRISVEDHGMGIPQEHLPKIFTPYFSTKGMGSGLGLATAYSIIQKHGGYIHVVSRVGSGTTFFIYLPAFPEKETEQGEKKIVLNKRKKGRVLVMDDDRNILKTVLRLLAYLGYEGEVAKNGEEAIEKYCKAKSFLASYDIVLMDLTILDGMGGKEAIARLLEIDPQIKAIVSSGYSLDPVMADFKKYGFKGVLIKPYSLRELGEALENLQETPTQ